MFKKSIFVILLAFSISQAQVPLEKNNVPRVSNSPPPGFKCLTSVWLDSLEKAGILKKSISSDLSHDPVPVEGDLNILCIMFAFNDSEDEIKQWPMTRFENPWQVGIVPEDNPWQPGRSDKLRKFFFQPIDVAGFYKVVVRDYYEKISFGRLKVNLIFPRPENPNLRWILKQNQSFFPDLSIIGSRALNDSVLSMVYRYNQGEYAPLFTTSHLVAIIRPDKQSYAVAFPYNDFPANVPFRIKNGTVMGMYPTNMSIANIFCHELGHLLTTNNQAIQVSLPDRGYDRPKTTPQGKHCNATSNYDLMFHDGHVKISDESRYGIPPMLAKDLIRLAWIDSACIHFIKKSEGNFQHVKLADLRTKLSNTEITSGLRNIAKVEFTNSPREYFLVEFHNGSDYDRFGNLDDPEAPKGLLIQHIVEQSFYSSDLIDIEIAVPQIDNSIADVRPERWNGMRYWDYLDDTMTDFNTYPYGLIGGRHYFLTIDNTDALHYYHQPCKSDFFAGNYPNPILRFTPYNPITIPNSKGWFGDNSQIGIINMKVEQGVTSTAEFDVIFYENVLVSQETATSHQIIWDMISNRSGDAILVMGNEQKNLYVQCVDARGTKKWSENGITFRESTGSGPSLTNARMVSDSQDGAIVAWEDGSGLRDIYAQRIDVSGNIKWKNEAQPGVPICTDPETNDLNVSIVADNFGGAVMAWFSKSRIRAQWVNNSGSIVWAANGIRVVETESHQNEPCIIINGYGENLVVWSDARVAREIYAQKLYSNGTRAWGNDGIRISFSEQGHSAYWPKMISDSNGGAIVVWEDRSQCQIQLRAQRFTRDGRLGWNEKGIVLYVTKYAASYDVVSDGKGGAEIVFQNTEILGEEDIYAQRIDGQGNLLWGQNGLTICNATGSQQRPKIASVGSGNSFISWLDRVNEWDYGENIYGQVIDENGRKLWGESGHLISDRDSYRHRSLLTAGRTSSVYFAWEDFRSGDGSGDIFMQWIDYSGSTSVAEKGSEPAQTLSYFTLAQNYPNPFNSSTSITYVLPKQSQVTVKIFNLLGQDIKTLLNEPMTEGNHTILWDGKDNFGNQVASGIYLYQLQAGDIVCFKKLAIIK